MHRLVQFFAACVVFSFGFVCVERRLSALVAQTERIHEINDHNWMHGLRENPRAPTTIKTFANGSKHISHKAIHIKIRHKKCILKE